MNFEDEPYARKYTRKTLTHKLLGWEGRAVLDAMLGEFDAAGIFEIRGDAARCISTVTEIPIEIARVGLERLVETETWVVTARVITWPTFEEAQNCRRSDRLRQRESRRARSAQSVTDVTTGHRPSRLSQPVTACHPPSPPPSAPTLPPTQSERDARAPDEPPEVPGLTVVHSGPLRPSTREQARELAAAALSAPIALRYQFDPDWDPSPAHREQGLLYGLSEKEILDRAEDCRRKPIKHGFTTEDDHFFRELVWMKNDRETRMFKTKAERDAFETPGRERRAT